MGAPIYYFDDFCLNPLARELSRNGEFIALAASAFDCLVYLIEHRERPVGRDELISAVWGREDVSDNLLAQTIVRLRRALGDAGNEQRCIKTIARVGYRWMLDTTVALQPQVDPGYKQGEAPGKSLVREIPATLPANTAESPTWVKYYFLAVLALVLAVIVGYTGWRSLHLAENNANVHFNEGSAIVLPVDVRAPEEWKWLNVGLIDLISTRMREAKVPTETSQAVLELLKDGANASGEGLSSFALVVHPRADLIGNQWHVRLEARSRDGRTWTAESSSEDILKASRSASDLLLAQLGYSAASSGGQVSRESEWEYLQRIDVARLAGQPDIARKLIDEAPPGLQANAELAYVDASLNCDEGKRHLCEQRLTTLLKQLQGKDSASLRAEVLTTLGLAYNEDGQHDQGESILTEAVNALTGQNQPEALATAYLDRSYVEQTQWKLDDATSDLGRARVNYALSGDAVGAAKTDFEMGLLAEQRAQPDAAVSLLQHAFDQFQGMGMRAMLPSTLDGLSYAQQMLLKFPDELHTTDEFWPLDEKYMGFIDTNMRHELSMVRAIALADNGRTSEATTLAELTLGSMDEKSNPALAAELNKLLAKIALEQGDNERAASWASKALTPALQDADKRDYAETWLTRITALQRAGKTDQARSDVSAMVTWEAHVSVKDDWTHIYVMRAIAAQSWLEGHREQAIEQLKTAMASAEKLGVPEVLVSVGKSYALALLDAGHLDQATAVSGRLSMWSNVDWRAAWVEARVYRTLGQMSSWEKSRDKARQLAGDRPLPGVSSGFDL